MNPPKVQATVLLLINQIGGVCLARKKSAIHHHDGEIDYSLGLYNGYGGKKEERDADISETALRELFDESGVTAQCSALHLACRVYFYIRKKKIDLLDPIQEDSFEPFMDVFFFTVSEWLGTPEEGDEMGPPHFFPKEAIPYDEMMPADRCIFEKILSGEKGLYQVKLQGRDLPPEVVLLGDIN